MRILYLLLLSMLCCSVYAQDSGGLFIGESAGETHAKAILQLESSSKGLLITRVTTSQREAMKVDLDDSAEALMVYDKDLHQFYYWNISDWKLIGSVNSPDLFNGIDDISIVGKQLVVVRRDGVSEAIDITTDNISEEGVNYFFNDFYKDQLDANTLAVVSNKTLIDNNTNSIVSNKVLTDKNTGDIAASQLLIDNNTNSIVSNKVLTDKNTGDIAANKLLIDGVANNAAVLQNTLDIAAHELLIQSNKTVGTQNTAAILLNKSLIDSKFDANDLVVEANTVQIEKNRYDILHSVSIISSNENIEKIRLNSLAILDKADKSVVEDNTTAIYTNTRNILDNVIDITLNKTAIASKASTAALVALKANMSANMALNTNSMLLKFDNYAVCTINTMLVDNVASYLVNVTNASTEAATSSYHPAAYKKQLLYVQQQNRLYFSDGVKWIDLTRADKVEEKLNNLITLIGNSNTIEEIKTGLSGL